ncbi:MAG: hypothetical protein ACI4HO_03450 [Ruminococcus sp.]
MKPSLYIGNIPFYDTPSEIEGSPYWVDLWTDVNGYKIGLQIKPTSYKSASMSIYAGKAKSSQEKGHKAFTREFGGKVFIVSPNNGEIKADVIKQVQNEYDLLMKMKPNDKK